MSVSGPFDLKPSELEHERKEILRRLGRFTTIHIGRPAGVVAAWSLQRDRRIDLRTDDRGILLASVRTPGFSRRWPEGAA